MRVDVLLEGDDLVIEDGDFKLGQSDLQHVYHILLNPPGAFKQFPLAGVGKPRFINGPLDGQLRREVQLQLEADGYRLKLVAVTPQGLDVQFDPV